MISSNEADDDDDSAPITNGAEMGNDERDFLIEKPSSSQAEMIGGEQRINVRSESKKSNTNNSIDEDNFSRLNIKYLFTELYIYLKKSTKQTTKCKELSSIKQQPNLSSRNFHKLHSQNLVNNRRIIIKSYLDDNENNDDYYYDDDDDDDLFRCVKSRGRGYSTARGRGHTLSIFLVAITLIFASLYLLIKLLILIQENKFLLAHQPIVINESQYVEGKSSRWLISSPKCHMPLIDPWHKSITPYVWLENDLNCLKISNDGFPPYALSYVEDNKLFLNNQAIAINNDCCYRSISRSEENDDDLVYNETCTQIDKNNTQALEIPFELIKLECPKRNYTNIHSFIVHDFEEEEAFKIVANKKLNVDQYYNVVLVGMDTVSRLNGYRQLSKTLNFLKDHYKTLEFYGYNKVGENTFPNLIPLLTGLKSTQLTETQCWLPTNYTDQGETGDDYLDNCKYLWNFYQEVGYSTYFSEDWARFSTFNYLKPGFKKKPTLFYGRPFVKARNNLISPKNPTGCSVCLFDKPIVEIDLKNLQNFMKEQQNSPYFALHWMNCPQHDDLNGASRVDLIVKKFFEQIHNLVNERTFVFFFSDHGYRWNDFVSTRVGHYEASLPLLTIAPPKHFIDNHPDLYENLKQHQASLLTPFDIFKTLIAIRDLGVKSEQNVTKLNRIFATFLGRTKNNDTTNSPAIDSESATTFKQLKQQDGLSYKQNFKTLSLLDKHSELELDRSCIDAGIPDNYCVCHDFIEANSSSLDVQGAAYYMVYVHLYNQLQHREDICEMLDLFSIKESKEFDFKLMKDLQIGNSRRRRHIESSHEDPMIKTSTFLNLESKTTQFLRATTPSPQKSLLEEFVIDETHYLPNKEYNILFATKPGLGLFQEVVRYYGSDIEKCKAQVDKMKPVISDPNEDHRKKYNVTMKMNEVCKFSVHSDSISRLNLYKGQSDCVNNNIELKKICYCKNK